jgi:hypothetical protein
MTWIPAPQEQHVGNASLILLYTQRSQALCRPLARHNAPQKPVDLKTEAIAQFSRRDVFSMAIA